MSGGRSDSRWTTRDDLVLRAAGRLRRGLRRDPRTGLLRFDGDRFVEAIEAVATEFAPAGLPLSIVLADVDRMGVLNRDDGRIAGDEAVAAVGQALRALVRPLDMVMTTGSDAFLLVLLGVDAGVAASRAEQARAAVAQLEVEAVPTGVTASFGVATRVQGEPARDLLQRALSAERRAKALGRDRVEVAPVP